MCQQKGYRHFEEETVSLHPCLAHTPISLCFTGFKLVFCILLYNSLSLSVYLSLSPPPSPLLHPHPHSFECPPLSVSVPCTYAPPRQSSALSITSHKRNKAKHTNQPQLTLGHSKEQESMVLVLAFGRGKQEPTKPTNQSNKEIFHKERNVFLSFYILVYKPSIFSKMISFF